MAMGHVILKAFHLDNPSDYFLNYCRTYTDMPMLVILEPRDDGSYTPGRMLRASDLLDGLGESNNPEWKTVAYNSDGELVAPNGSIGFRWGEKGKMESRTTGRRQRCRASCRCWIFATAWCRWASPYFGGNETRIFAAYRSHR